MRFLGGLALSLLLSAPAAAKPPPRLDPDFELYDLRTDKLVRLSRLRHAADLVVVDFFSVSCRPCRKALPAWTRLHERHAGVKLVLVAVPDRDDRDAALRRLRRFFKRRTVSFPVVWDKYLVVARRFGVVRKNTLRLPQAFVLDRAGKLLLRAREPRSVAALVQSR